MDAEIFAYFSSYLKEHTGIHYTDAKAFALEGRLNEMVENMAMKSIQELYNAFQLNITSAMHQRIVDLATNNETSFFRDTRPFKVLVDEIMPRLRKERDSSIGFNIWSAAASSGQEIYSIVMMLNEKYPDLMPHIMCDASDISTEILDRARSGNFSQLEVQRGLPVRFLSTYFTQHSDDKWHIKEQVSRKVRFFKFNLLTDKVPTKRYDVIFLRNVLIYFDIADRRNIVKKIFEGLRPGGYMILGNSESLLNVSDQFEREQFPNYTAFKKP